MLSGRSLFEIARVQAAANCRTSTWTPVRTAVSAVSRSPSVACPRSRVTVVVP